MIEKTVGVEKYLAEYSYEAAKFYLYLVVGFLVPFTIGHPQLLVGIIVNAILVVSALEIKRSRYVLPILCAPSLAVLSRGLIFGPLTPYLVIMLPFIWVGNAILFFGVRTLYKRRNENYGISLGFAAAAKTAFLFMAAFMLVSFAVLPTAFLASMGILQLITAIGGGVLGFGIYKTGATSNLFARFF